MKSTYVEEATQVAIVAWNEMDLTDFTGPLEVLSHARNNSQERLLKTTIAAATELSSTSQGVSVARDIDTQTLLSNIASYDVLIIPGGGGFTPENIPAAPGVREALKAWSDLPARQKMPRILMSICAGAIFLAEAGLLVDKTATTHYASLKSLQTVGKTKGNINVVRQHYVDAGTDSKGQHIITSGGIVSGFDSTLYLVEIQHGLETAERARAIMDATWRREMTPFGFV